MPCQAAITRWGRRWVLLMLAASPLVTALGCGGSSATKEDTKTLVNLVTEVADGISTNQGVAEIFATGAAVPQKKAEQEQYFNKRFFTTKKDIRVSGDTAQITVHVDDANRNPLPDVQWTAVRENGRWKLSSIPLP